MLGFVRNFVPYRGNPIGVDIGAGSIRLAQIERDGAELRLIHAENIPTPPGSLGDGVAQPDFFAKALRQALKAGSFRGRRIAIGLPPSLVQVKHLRMNRAAEADMPGLVAEQATTALGSHFSQWLLRHVSAGDVFGEQVPQQEVVLFATPQDLIQQLLEEAGAARVEVVGVHVQPRVAVQAFAELYRRKADADAVNLFVDLGHSGTRAVVAAPSDIRFVRTMPLGASAIHTRIAAAMHADLAEIAILRRSAIAVQTGRSNEIPAVAPTMSDPQVKLQEATEVEARRLADELEMCRRYYEATFPNKPVTRLIFVGGGAKDRLLCAAVAQAMALPAQIGDPLIRFNRAALPSLDCIDRREPQPEWAVAIGLSLCGQSVAVAA